MLSLLIRGISTTALTSVSVVVTSTKGSVSPLISGLPNTPNPLDLERHLHPPSETEVEDSSLARQHLMFGYQHDVWDFHQVGKEESVRKYEEIE